MKKIFVTRTIPENGLNMLHAKGYFVTVSKKDGPLTKEELIQELQKDSYDAVVSLLTDPIDPDVFAATPSTKIFANYAVGFNNFDIEEAKKRNVFLTNTPGVLTDSVAEHTMALALALTCRIVEGDIFVKSGKYVGWDPLLLIGKDLKGSTLGIIGSGRIGARIAYHAKGFDMKIAYYDVVRNENIEKEQGAVFYATVEEVLRMSDVVVLAVPLLDSTRHLINKERLAIMKPSAYLINTARGPVIDEKALVEALQKGTIRGAGLDVYENEPELAQGLKDLPNVVLTPHIASATEFARSEMSRIAAENIIDVLEGRIPKNSVY